MTLVSAQGKSAPSPRPPQPAPAIMQNTQLPPSRPSELRPPTPAAGPADRSPEPNGAKPPSAASVAPADRTQPAPSSCLARLAAISGNLIEKADMEVSRNDPACHVEEPVRLRALALQGASTVVFDPPPLLSCAMATAVADWLGTSVAPLAQGHLGLGLVGLRVGGGQECRRRNRASAGPLSEHATGQALDIFAFKLTEGDRAESVVVEKPFGLRQNRFLAAVRQSACGAFMTTLGPGSDAAHANHLHVDIQERRSHASRFCQ